MKAYIKPYTILLKDVAENKLMEDTWGGLSGSPSHVNSGAAPARRMAGNDGPAGL